MSSDLQRIVTILLLTVLSLCGGVKAAQRQDSIIVSLITCWPGQEVYELCGHEAVRVRGVSNGVAIDSVWNYGTFDFEQPNFVYRFVKGETDYMLSAYPFSWFLPEYEAYGRRVVEQDLNLTPEEAARLHDLLRDELRPDKRIYRYNYVKDNCATRIIDRLDLAVGAPVVYPDSVSYGTFRDEMRAFHKDYPWYQFGIDLALGSGLDYPLTGREEMFVPLEMMRKAQHARLPDGRPLVRETRVLYEGVPDATLGPTPWYAAPLFWSCVILLLALGVCFVQWRKTAIFRAVYCVWFGILGLMGCVVAFLMFISSHEATSPNMLILWLNPLQLVIAAGIWFRRKGRWLTMGMVYFDIILLTVLLVGWPFQVQSANPAFFPLMGATLALAVTYAILTPKISLKRKAHNHEEICNLGARRPGHSRRVGTVSRRPAATRGRNRR